LTLGIGPNASIFEICAAIEAQGGININAVLNALRTTLLPLVTAQIQASTAQIAAALVALGVPAGNIPALVTLILANINYPAIVGQIIAEVDAALDIFIDCSGIRELPIRGLVGGFELPTVQQLPTVQEMIPTVQQQSSQGFAQSGDPMLQLQTSLSPIL
jgi:hypothetical protein